MPDLVSNLQEPGRPGDDGGVLQTHNVILNIAKQKLLWQEITKLVLTLKRLLLYLINDQSCIVKKDGCFDQCYAKMQ